MSEGKEPEEEQKAPIVLAVEAITMKFKAVPATLWLSFSFAPEWYEDALAEARGGGDYRNRRREILFAVCVAESYLLEWVRDGVLTQNFPALKKYFPSGARRGVAEKWKTVLKKLKNDGLIPAIPDFSDYVSIPSPNSKKGQKQGLAKYQVIDFARFSKSLF